MSVGPGGDVEVTVVVVTWQRRELTLACLASLARQTLPHRVLLVDNASTDGTEQAVRAAYPLVEVVRLPENRGFAGAIAHALPLVQTRFVALLNNDAWAEPGWLAASLAVLHAWPQAAGVTARMLLDGGAGSRRINNAGVVLRKDGYGADRGLGDLDDERYAVPGEVFGFSGGAAVLRTLAVRAVGGFDSDYFLYYEDTDVSWRLRLAGWSVRYCPEAVVHHRHAASSDPASVLFAFHTERNRLLTLLRDAPLGYAARCGARFLVTTGSLAVKRTLRRPVPTAPVFDPALRIRVLADVTRRLPAVLAARPMPRGGARRRAVLRAWRGVEFRPAGTGG